MVSMRQTYWDRLQMVKYIQQIEASFIRSDNFSHGK